jgi:hypothetical protein
LSGPATRRILEREHSAYGQAAYQRLAGISVAHLYRLRNTAAYRKRNTSYQPTRPTPIPIGERRKPRPLGMPGYLRIDTVHRLDEAYYLFCMEAPGRAHEGVQGAAPHFAGMRRTWPDSTIMDFMLKTRRSPSDVGSAYLSSAQRAECSAAARSESCR